MNVADLWSPALFPVTLTVEESSGEFGPTLNFADKTPVEPVTVQGGSPVVSGINDPAVTLIAHPVSEGSKPVPEMVTSVAVAVGGPITGANPVSGLSVILGKTANATAVDVSPWSGVTTTL